MSAAYRVLSMWQPWATLTVAIDPIQDPPRPAKGIESRHWEPRDPLPIPVVIHATKKMDKEIIPLLSRWPFADCLERSGYYPGDPRPFTERNIVAPRGKRPLPLGTLIGVATIARVETSVQLHHRISSLTGSERVRAAEEVALGDYGPNRFGFLLTGAVEFPEPIPFHGRQDVLYHLDPQTTERVLEQLERAASSEAHTT